MDRGQGENHMVQRGGGGRHHLPVVPFGQRQAAHPSSPPTSKPKPNSVWKGRQYEIHVPTVADRIAQTVVAARLEKDVEPTFHPDSFGYRPGRSALDAVARCRERCWNNDWVIDLDIQKFFDSVPWNLIVKAVEANTDQPWVILYVKRWPPPCKDLMARRPDGTVEPRRAQRFQCQSCSLNLPLRSIVTFRPLYSQISSLSPFSIFPLVRFPLVTIFAATSSGS
jgi:hypothetical protein